MRGGIWRFDSIAKSSIVGPVRGGVATPGHNQANPSASSDRPSILIPRMTNHAEKNS